MTSLDVFSRGAVDAYSPHTTHFLRAAHHNSPVGSVFLGVGKADIAGNLEYHTMMICRGESMHGLSSARQHSDRFTHPSPAHVSYSSRLGCGCDDNDDSSVVAGKTAFQLARQL